MKIEHIVYRDDEEVKLLVEFEYYKGCKGTHFQPPEPEEVEIYLVTDMWGHVEELTDQEINEFCSKIFQQRRERDD